MKPTILFIVPAEYQALKIKGVEEMIFERDENGFFGKVITIHPFCNETKVILLNKCHEIHEIGFDLLPGAGKIKILKYLQIPIHFLRIIWKIVALVKKNKVHLIRANDPFWMGFLGYISSKICGVPFCVSIHADFDKRMALDKKISLSTVFGSYSLALRLESFIYRRADLILPIRKSLADKAVTRGAILDKIRIIPHGIDLVHFESPICESIDKKFKVDSHLKIASFVGRLVRENYVHDILSVARKLGALRSDFVIVVVGGGKEEFNLKTIIEEDPILSRCIYLAGFQKRLDCFDLRRSSLVSLCLMGGFSLIEACAAAKPVIAYDVEWHSELVIDYTTGFLIQENDVNGVVNKLSWLFDHPSEGIRMGQNAKTLAFSKHNILNTSKIKIAAYRELLTQNV